jgi:hypothetical protein
MPCPLPLLIPLSSAPSTAPQPQHNGPVPSPPPPVSAASPQPSAQPSAHARLPRPPAARCRRPPTRGGELCMMQKAKTRGPGTPPRVYKGSAWEFFQKIILLNPGISYPPRGWDPQKNFKLKIQPGPALPGTISAFHRLPSTSLWLPSLRTVVGLEWPCAPLFYLLWEGYEGRILGCRCSRRGRSARVRTAAPHADSFMPATSGVGTIQSLLSGQRSLHSLKPHQSAPQPGPQVPPACVPLLPAGRESRVMGLLLGRVIRPLDILVIIKVTCGVIDVW